MTPLDFVEALRKVIVETLIPEIRELREDSDRRFEAMQKQMDDRFNVMQKQMDNRFNAVQQQLQFHSELLRKIIDKLDVAERVNKLEASVDMISRKVFPV
ncbi:MAG: hypothetical protein AB1765_09825 [Candidatus Hydrogenedentota bacterium]